jgi:PAS domain S-box-containing protein
MTTALRPNTGSSEGTDVLIPSPRQCHADQRPQQSTAQSSIPREPRFPSGEWSRAIFMQSPDGILLLSDAGLIFAANPAACQMLQRTEEEICHLGWDALVDIRAGGAGTNRMWTGHFRGALTLLRADGNPLPADVSSTRFTDDSGQERVVVFFHDVSDRKQAENAFQESQALFRGFMTNSPALAYIKDDEGRYVYVNPLAAQVIGHHCREVVGKTDADLWPAETARKVRETDTTVFEMALPVMVEESVELADGIHHWLSFKFPIAVPHRQLLGGMSVDITERLTAEEALRHANSELETRVAERTHALEQANADLRTEIAARRRAEDTLRTSEERYRIINQSISDCAFSFKVTEDGTTFYDWVSDNFTKIAGIAPDEIFGNPNPLKNTLHPEDRSVFMPMLMTLEPGNSITSDLRLMHKGGELRWIRTYIHRVRNEPDHALRFHGAAQDITERKQAQEEIVRLNETLKQHVSDLSDLNQELESFSYSVSHDLRAPLRHVHGFVELLHKHAAATLDDKGRRYIEVITKSAKRMGQLIDDLLSFSHTTRAELRPTRVNLTQIVNEVVLDFAEETATRKILWDVNPLPDVYGDVALLRVVLSNLLGNAVKYTRPRDTPRITIGETTTAENARVCFVRDNGAGFDMHYVDKLFGVFQRLHRDDEFEGTGIGLATVRRIVHRLGGRVWAEGEVDRGATFYFSLPTTQKGIEG